MLVAFNRLLFFCRVNEEKKRNRGKKNTRICTSTEDERVRKYSAKGGKTRIEREGEQMKKTNRDVVEVSNAGGCLEHKESNHVTHYGEKKQHFLKGKTIKNGKEN